MPVRLYVGGQGAEVPVANSEHCLTALRAHRSDASIVDVGDVDHLQSNRLATGAIAARFHQLP